VSDRVVSTAQHRERVPVLDGGRVERNNQRNRRASFVATPSSGPGLIALETVFVTLSTPTRDPGGALTPSHPSPSPPVSRSPTRPSV